MISGLREVDFLTAVNSGGEAAGDRYSARSFYSQVLAGRAGVLRGHLRDSWRLESGNFLV